MHKLGAYFTYWAEKYNTDYDECIRRAAALGFDAVGLRGTGVVEFSREKMSATRKLADDLGVKLSYIAALANHDISSEDATVRKESVAYIRRIIDAVGFMGGDILGGSFYARWHGALPVGVTDKRPHLERSADCMRDLCKAAADYGMNLSLEILNRYESFLLNTTPEGMDYIDRVGCGNLGLLLDTFHMNIEEDTLPGAIRTAGDRLTHFHVGEANRDVPRPDGHIPWPEVFAALREINYGGIVEFEPFVVMGTEIGTNVCLWRDLVRGRNIDEILKESLEFIRSQIAGSAPGSLFFAPSGK